MKWVIKDWAGNYPFEKYNRQQGSGHLGSPIYVWETFDDAEDFLTEFLGDSYEECRGEYEIDEVEGE
jgi:hypothetical protein